MSPGKGGGESHQTIIVSTFWNISDFVEEKIVNIFIISKMIDFECNKNCSFLRILGVEVGDFAIVFRRQILSVFYAIIPYLQSILLQICIISVI